MSIDFKNSLDLLNREVSDLGNAVSDKTKEFHKNFVSKVTPKAGKFGDALKFTAEMVPGVAEYNSIREGKWGSLAISSLIDGGILISGGTSILAKAGIKSASEIGIKTIEKEVTSKGAKTLKELASKSPKEIDKIIENPEVKKIAEKTVNKFDSSAYKPIEKAVDTNTKLIKNPKEILESEAPRLGLRPKNDLVRNVTTINAQLLGKKHPITGVEFVNRSYRNTQGDLCRVVVPKFDYLFKTTLPKELHKETFSRQKTYLTKLLKTECEKNPKHFMEYYGFNKTQASEILEGRTPSNLTWHHDAGNGKMQLVDREIHSRTEHTGGMSFWGQGHNTTKNPEN